MMILFICGLIKNIIDVMDEEKNLLGFEKKFMMDLSYVIGKISTP